MLLCGFIKTDRVYNPIELKNLADGCAFLEKVFTG